jgi:hypothetical protein
MIVKEYFEEGAKRKGEVLAAREADVIRRAAAEGRVEIFLGGAILMRPTTRRRVD